MIRPHKKPGKDLPIAPGMREYSGFGTAHDEAVPEGELLAEQPGLDGSLWRLFLYPLEAVEILEEEFTELAAETENSNPFYHPVCLAAGIHRVWPRGAHLLVLWENIGSLQKMRFMLPIVAEKARLAEHVHFEALAPGSMKLSDPLLQGGMEEEVLERLFALIRMAFENGLPPIRLSHLRQTSQLLRYNAGTKLENLAIASSSSDKRTVFDRATASEANSGDQADARKLGAELGTVGTVKINSTRDPMEIMLRFEEFLLLDSTGRNRRKRAPLYNLKKLAAFARQTVHGLATKGQCEIFTLRLDERPVASLVMFRSSGQWFAWKLAVSEQYRRFRPESILLNAAAADIASREGFERIDPVGIRAPSSWNGELQFSRFVLAPDIATAERLAGSDLKPGWFARIVSLLKHG